MFNILLRAVKVRRTRRWILSLDSAEMLALMVQPDTGLDTQDCDGLVQLAFDSCPDARKQAIVDRIADHLSRRINPA